ncbi:Annexin D4 [Vitis vinifera]|uniref:Annexin D4 n=1 Tax=Vitis vinifera TaxID=29760 RepID=A0A438G493_VITVI|nr:Annexin D4 [Vitis vinifera]
MVSILGKWHLEHLESFRKRTPKFFLEDERLFERWDDHHIACLTKEFLRFKDIVVQWIMHPWERDARLVHEAITKGPQAYGLLIEIACTRSSKSCLELGKLINPSLTNRSRMLLLDLKASKARKTTKMDPPNDFEALTKAFSGFGVDEDSMVSILGKWHSEHLESFRRELLNSSWRMNVFLRGYCWCNGSCILGKGMLVWCMRLFLRVLKHMVCSLRLHAQESSEELLGARKAYQSLFDQSIEDVASRL